MKGLLLALLALGCENAPSEHPSPDLSVAPFCTDGADGGPPATFSSVQAIFTAHCAVPMCHDGSPQAPIVMQDLRAGQAYSNVVRVTAYETCHNGGVPLTRVVPGDAGASFLYHKLVDDTPCEGSQMPLSEVGPFPLPTCATDVIRRWIDDGAQP